MLGLVFGPAAAALEALAGPLFRAITLPLIISAGLTFAKMAWDKRDARLMKRGEEICESGWRERAQATGYAQASAEIDRQRAILAQERATMEGLTNANVELQARISELQAGASADPRCLSDGVLNAVRSRNAPGDGAARATGKPGKKVAP